MCITSLRTLLQGIATVPSVFDVTIHGLATDSRKVSAGDAFVALAGSQTPADQYLGEAIAAGAAVILLETAQAGECYESEGALVVPVENLRARLGRIADRFYEHTSQRLRLIGVTGPMAKHPCLIILPGCFRRRALPVASLELSVTACRMPCRKHHTQRRMLCRSTGCCRALLLRVGKPPPWKFLHMHLTRGVSMV